MLSEDNRMPITEDKPRDRFDIFFDQIMGISGTSRPRKTATTRQKRSAESSMDHDERKEHGQSSTSSPSKRTKTSDTSFATRQTRSETHFKPAVDTDSEVVELSDPENLSPFWTARRTSPFATASFTPHRQPDKSVPSSQARSGIRHYPEPSSSQDRRSFLDDAVVIIDLT
jgi:hypothetical protein